MSSEPSEFERHSFVVKIWLEELDASSDQATWRGHITHVGSQQRQYVQSLSDISSFIAGFLLQWGLNLDWKEGAGWGS